MNVTDLLVVFYFLVTCGNNLLFCNQPSVTGNAASANSIVNDTTNNIQKGIVHATSQRSLDAITPEMYGATGDGQVHKLSEKFKNIDDARKVYTDVKDLNITLDGAALQKAVDVAAKTGQEIDIEKKYVINFPVITRNNIIIDGKNKGQITNDNSRPKSNHHLVFYMGDHSSSAFYNPAEKGKYQLYDVKGAVTAGDNHVQLANASDVSSFKAGQLVMVTSSYKRARTGRKLLLPYHITMSKITKIEGNNLYFEYPIDESVPSVQIAANGNYDPSAEINFGGVDNVTLRNFTVDAEHLTLRTYAYKCSLSNIKVLNGIRVIGINAMAHSTINNISGTFAWRGIEIKTGSSDLIVHNVNATYKALPQFPQCNDVISLGEYNRTITIDSFKMDVGNGSLVHPLIDLRSRKATISNGTIICKNQKKPFIKFYNETYITDPKFGCYANTVKNVKFYGSPAMKSVLDLGDEDGDDDDDMDDDAVDGKKQRRAAAVAAQKNSPDYVNVPPSDNVIENCLFDGGNQASVAALNQGQQNTIKNCVFTKARLKIASDFLSKNIVTGNKENK